MVLSMAPAVSFRCNVGIIDGAHDIEKFPSDYSKKDQRRANVREVGP
jgi:hypothetical protein